ncbi:bifunctional lysylphosphatidylglycerol synthetase/lysine--tRNA ligase LysX [Intrasporangium flavum]|uniref:bifunctional lysylphosphatidylglycerol synthetase/lysine--tRNA ligase LysX n=1 Tax=Intrasporangium flavum TaxID=1428657 RepID=UPI00096FF357|nr:bifunctional lysylphosphatidylglycerol synthetase/lysine--tRNA ligase LysX [Intrasporangium flavum]
MATRRPVDPGSPRAARVLTGTYAVAIAAALLLALFHPRRPGPSPAEVVFGLLNVPVAPTVVSVVVLAIVTRALLGRKRIGLWVVAAFQALGVLIGLVAVLPPARRPFVWMWQTRGDLGRVVDIAGIVVALAAGWWLWRLRGQFTGRLQRGSGWLAAVALVVGSLATLGVAWGLLGAVGVPRSQARAVVGTVFAVLGGVSPRPGGFVPPWVVDVVALCVGLTILVAVTLFLASARPVNRWSPDREVSLRRLLARSGAGDSLGYFATRRDKASVFDGEGRAAVTYAVAAGVSLAAADPIGPREAWLPAIDAWRAEAREYGWLPAVIAASEEGARAYASRGMRVVALGDEAVLDPRRVDLDSARLTRVRQAATRARRAGVTVRVRRQADLSPEEREQADTLARQWRSSDTERGFSMALGRTGDPADGRVVHVLATGEDGVPVGLLTFVPWGRGGVSLDLMRRSPAAPNGTTELMVTEVLARADELGVGHVSLNFCMFRGVFAGSARLGSGTLTRLNASVLGLFDRFWQLERLYRATDKYDPEWTPRFLCYDDGLSLPQIAVAAAALEGFVPWPARHRSTSGVLDAERLAEVAALEASGPLTDPGRFAPRRSEESRHRLATLDRLRASGIDPYPVGGGTATPLALVPGVRCGTWTEGEAVEVVARVRELRDHGAVVFVTLEEAGARVQALLESSRTGRRSVDRFAADVDTGDLVRLVAETGHSRTGTPTLLVEDWRLEAKALHPVPWRGLADPEARVRRRSTDLLAHPGELELLRRRSSVVAALRRTLADRGFLEVETPMLHVTHGGATARPFRTHINAYGTDLSLRIAPELYLKRLLVGGIGPVFELGRSFRNEGADATHNPEFTSLEVYEPHADYVTMRHLAECLVREAATAVHGRPVIPLPTPERVRAGLDGVDLVDVGAPFPVVRVLDAVSEAVGLRVGPDTDLDVLLEVASRHGVTVPERAGWGAVVEELYAELVEPVTVLPTFYTDFPVETSPLVHPHRTERGLVERWDLVVAGMEVGTAYSELTDPVDQRRRLTEQSLRAAAGDPEAMEVDEDFLHALELGMPPTGGLGIGVDRLVMLLTNTSIRSVLTFPFVRPEPARPREKRETPSWS